MKMRVLFFWGALLATQGFSAPNEAKPLTETPAENFASVCEDGAWCWFSDPRAVYYEGKHKRTYVGWITRWGHIEVGYYDHETGESKQVRLHQNLQRDDHAIGQTYLEIHSYKKDSKMIAVPSANPSEEK